jgi:hypothetical protein
MATRQLTIFITHIRLHVKSPRVSRSRLWSDRNQGVFGFSWNQEQGLGMCFEVKGGSLSWLRETMGA